MGSTSLCHTPCLYKHGVDYKYVLVADFEVILLGSEWPNLASSAGRIAGDTQGRGWLEWTDVGFIIKANYASDGCSPKKKIAGKWVGTPDFDPGTIAASIAHDGLYQTMHLSDFPLSLYQVNNIFYQIMRFNNFNWLISQVYYQSVAKIGPAFYRGGSSNIVWINENSNK